MNIEIDISPDKKIDFCYIWNLPKYEIYPTTILMKVKKTSLIEELSFIRSCYLLPGSHKITMNKEKMKELLKLKRL